VKVNKKSLVGSPYLYSGRLGHWKDNNFKPV